MNKIFFRVLLFVFPAFFCLGAKGAEEFVIGTASGYAPYVSLNERLEYVGFDIDLAEEIAAKLGRKLVIKDFGSMPALFLALKQKKVDALIWGISITEERKRQMTMIRYQGEPVTSLPLLFWKTIPAGVTSLDDLALRGKSTICVEGGSFQESFLLGRKGLDVKPVDKVTDAVLELKYGKSLATVIDPFLLPIFTSQFPEIAVIDTPLPLEEQSLGNGICVRKEDAETALQVTRAVEALEKEGKISLLEKKWNLGRNG